MCKCLEVVIIALVVAIIIAFIRNIDPPEPAKPDYSTKLHAVPVRLPRE